MQLAFLVGSPVAGAVLGALTAPIAQALFEGQLNVAEGAIDRLTPAEIAGGAIGLIVGSGHRVSHQRHHLRTRSRDVGRAGTYIAIVLYLIVAIFSSYFGARIGAEDAHRARPEDRCQRRFRADLAQNHRHLSHRRRSHRRNRRDADFSKDC